MISDAAELSMSAVTPAGAPQTTSTILLVWSHGATSATFATAAFPVGIRKAVGHSLASRGQLGVARQMERRRTNFQRRPAQRTFGAAGRRVSADLSDR
jgi:hypothetical protein